MSIREISENKLRRMEHQEGLIIQGCGGDLQEWVDGINEMLTQEGILKKGAKFEEVYTFRHGELFTLLQPWSWRYSNRSIPFSCAEAGIKTEAPFIFLDR